ncbi:MAG: hypothetical protein FWF52_08585 [Candidatus Azobacteroides sp.]|nr:hypothetical protein [Candidatus Azobacteroides sp.]
MNRDFWRKILYSSPVVVLIVLLIYINISIGQVKSIVYDYIFTANVETIKNFSSEIKLLLDTSLKYGKTEGKVRSIFDLIEVFNKAIGGKYAVITFLADSDRTIYHSNNYNQAYVSGLLENRDNEAYLNQLLANHESKDVFFKNNGEDQHWYCQALSGVNKDYCMFVTVDKNILAKRIRITQVIIPLCILSMLLLLSTEVSIWAKSNH